MRKSSGLLCMVNYFSHYCALLGSQDSLGYCQQAVSLGDLLARIKQLWHCAQLGDDELLGEIHRLNQVPVDDSVILAGNWLPYRYQPKQRLVHWLIPHGHATEPFQDEYISRCCQELFNQIIQPRTSLESALRQASAVADAQPAGFIFHLSRCGSTLISGCLSELDSTCVFSESPLLTELLLDNQLTTDEQRESLRAFIDLQAAAFSGRPQMIIKWNAWDIFQWELIRSLYPRVPAIFLVRDPVEILASHQRIAGRHMAGDPTLGELHPVFKTQSLVLGLLDRRLEVLRALLLEMSKKTVDPHNLVVDYQQINTQYLAKILTLCGCAPDKLGFLKIQERMRFNSKAPGQIFVDDSIKKQHCFTVEEQERIRLQLKKPYTQLLMLALKSLAAVIDDH